MNPTIADNLASGLLCGLLAPWILLTFEYLAWKLNSRRLRARDGNSAELRTYYEYLDIKSRGIYRLFGWTWPIMLMVVIWIIGREGYKLIFIGTLRWCSNSQHLPSVVP